METFARAQKNTPATIVVLARRAPLKHAGGDREAALEGLAQAVRLTEPSGWVRLLADLGPQVADLLVHLRQKGVARAFIEQILAAFGTADERRQTIAEPGAFDSRPSSAVRGRPSAPEELFEPLTDRELQVLALLARRQTYKKIAAQLYISPGTVTTHAHHICQKLDVPNRRQAVARAEALSLLPAS